MPSAPPAPAHILIVDDNPLNIQAIASILQHEGYAMSFALEGESALANAKERPFDLILLDIMMPKLSGFEVCQQLKAAAETADVPVIFLTAKTDVESIGKAFAVGGVDYVTKPFYPVELLARVKTHLRLKHTEHHLRALNASKDNFLSIVSHDLRGPFSVLLSLTKLLVRNFDHYQAEDMRENIGVVHDAAQHFYKLLDNLLNWSRLQRGVIRYRPARFDVAALVTEVCGVFALTTRQKQLRLHNQVPAETWVDADIDMLSTVLRNLIGNAIKFSYPDSDIEVGLSLAAEPGWCCLSVQDHGVGIRAEDLPKLFRIDSQHKTVGTAGEEGTGLGLVLCQDLIEKHGGHLWVESQPQQGTCFYFTIPLAGATNSATTPA